MTDTDEKNKSRKYTRIVDTFDRLAGSYGGPEGLEEVNRIKLAAWARKLEGRLLDVGCGSGTFIEKYFKPEKQFLVSADFSENMILAARLRLVHLFGDEVRFVQSLAQALPLPDEAFDACLCINTLHNMPQWEDVERAVAEMARVLRRGGTMILEFRNLENPVRRRITQLYDWPHLPQKAFTFAQMKKLLNNLGITIEQKIHLFGERPGKGRVWEPATGGLIGHRAPRIGIIARKSPGFKSFIEDENGE